MIGIGAGGYLCAHRPAAFHPHLAFGKEPQRLRIELMLDREDTRGERLGGIAGQNRSRRPVAITGPSSMPSVTKCTVQPCDPHAGVDGALMRVEVPGRAAAGKGGC